MESVLFVSITNTVKNTAMQLKMHKTAFNTVLNADLYDLGCTKYRKSKNKSNSKTNIGINIKMIEINPKLK